MKLKPKLRASRVVAICRIALTLALILTLPSYSVLSTPAGYLALLGYLTFSVAMLVIASCHWWLNHHLRIVGFLVDASASLLILYWVENGTPGFVSPFMAFYTYLVVTGTLLWRARGAAFAAVSIITCYIAVGLLMHGQDSAWDADWFGRRLVFMGVIGGLVFWFGLQRTKNIPDRLDWPLDATIDEQIEAIAKFVFRHIHCTGVAIAWMPNDEPWTQVSKSGSCGSGSVRLSPDAFIWSDDQAVGPLLFDRQRQKGLQLVEGDGIIAIRNLPDCPLANYMAARIGIAAPIRSETGRGSLLLTGIAAVSGDQLRPVRELAEEIGYALDRHEMAMLMRIAESTRVRLAVARDLHDGVAQSLAGASFRLEALRQAALAGKDIIGDLGAIQKSLAQEEQVVVDLIAQLRGDQAPSSFSDFAAEIGKALTQSAEHWGISAGFEGAEVVKPLPRKLVLEIQWLVREAVANAARHGGADKVTLSLGHDQDTLLIDIVDNGSGFGTEQTSTGPRSILDRVAALGGTVDVATQPGQTRLSISLPFGVSR